MNYRIIWVLTVLVAIVALPTVLFSDPIQDSKVARKNPTIIGESGQPLRNHFESQRQGGDTVETAVEITSIPFLDSGTTCGYHNDYNFQCPSQSAGLDVVYSISLESDAVVTVDLCLSSFDTVVSLVDSLFQVVECNDDYYFDDDCGVYVSRIDHVALVAGVEYYIIVDGYSYEECGDYSLSIFEYQPCIVSCNGSPENEPQLHDGYVDSYNSGCSGNGSFQECIGDPQGMLEFCGTSGWYVDGELNSQRDTDWFVALIGDSGYLELSAESEMEMWVGESGPLDCEDYAVLQSINITPCSPQGFVVYGEPGTAVWLWVAADGFSAPGGFLGHEFAYKLSLSGLNSGPVSTENTTWDSLKSFYRFTSKR